MKLEERKVIFCQLGERLSAKIGTEEVDNLIRRVKNKNAWFTEDNILMSLNEIIRNFLNKEKLDSFLEQYNEELFKIDSPKKIGIVAAGNIPLVGFHDLLTVILSGNIALFKPSSTDEVLMNYVIEELISIDPAMSAFVEVVERLNAADAFIATGSNNSSRYFEYYFSSKPSIIRSNRTSIAVLDGNEDRIQLGNLGNDIFCYFGLGCRNVSKLFVPKGYTFDKFYESIEYWNTIRMHHKYNNNYDYNKSIYLVNMAQHLDNGFLLLREDQGLSSPISVLYYQQYESPAELNTYLEEHKDQLQAIVSENVKIENAVGFGKSQSPELGQFADNVDTMAFLLNLA